MLVTNSKGVYAVFVLLISVTLGQALGQTGPVSSRGRTSAEVLRIYGIDSSEAALRTALLSPNARVRVLAAHQLARDKRTDAADDVERALSKEEDPMSRVGLATALASLHDSRGLDVLQAMCANEVSPIRSSIASTQMIELLGESSKGCIGPLVARLENPGSADYRDTLIPLVAGLYTTAPSDLSAQIASDLQKFLADKKQQPSVRLAASHGLAQIGLASSIPILEEAVGSEKDLVIRQSFNRDLRALNSRK